MQNVKLAAVRDAWVSGFEEERDQVMPRERGLKLKGIQEVALLDFDVSSLRGKEVVSAALWMHIVPEVEEEEKQRLALTDRGHLLRHVGVSTIGSPWGEPSAITYGSPVRGREWAYPGSRLWDVVFGNGHSQHCHGEVQHRGDGWWSLPLDPRVVTALATGHSAGLAVQCENHIPFWLAPTVFVHSRDSAAFAPYLEVTVREAEALPSGRPTDLQVAPEPAFASLLSGAARISLRAPEGAFGYRVRVNGSGVPAWRVPYAAPGEMQSFVLEDLPGGVELVVEVRAVDAAGRVGEAAIATGRVSPLQAPPPVLPLRPFAPSSGGPPSRGALSVWAFPEVTKVDPVTAEARFEPAADVRQRNAIWDGARARVRLAGARGEAVAFQLAIESQQPLPPVQLTPEPLASDGGRIAADHFRLFRVWYVPVEDRWQGEYAIPLDGPLSLPAEDNGVPGQRVQAVYVDLNLPHDAVPGAYRGRFGVRAGGDEIALDLEVQVYPVTIPPEMRFNTELNCYSSPGAALGTPYFYAVHRLAHYLRCTLNVLPYNQTGGVVGGYAPGLAGAGADTHASDWGEFDRLVGPLLDGSAFAGNPRGRTPVRVFYLPIFEHWPLSLWEHYAFSGDPKEEATQYRHMLEAPPIEQAFPPHYREVMARVVGEWVAHCEARGWTGTDFQMYLNNKPFWGGTYWTLDEPTCRLDWQAIRFYAQAFRRGIAQAQSARFVFRGDISRPQWQYDQLDGLMDTICYNNQIFSYPTVATRLMNRRLPDPHVYGMLNEIGRANHESAIWCLKAYALGLNGILPWQSIGGAKALREPDLNGLLVPGALAGCDGPVASLRVFALRRAAQDIELLHLLADRRGYTREQMGALIAQRIPLGSTYSQRFTDEAAALQVETAGAEAFADLKEGVLQLLSDG